VEKWERRKINATKTLAFYGLHRFRSVEGC
jgi:hypothetical protein